MVEVGFAREASFMKDIPGNGFSVRGEAVAIDIAPGRTLFALLSPPPERGSDMSWFQAMLFGDAMRAGAVPQPAFTLPGNGQDVGAHDAIGRAHAKLTLPPQLYPLLVTFGDIRDPKSIMRVDPADLAATLGAGVKLSAITVEVKDAAVTTGIERKLEWLPKVYDRLRGSDLKPDGIPVGNFKQLFSTELGN